MALSDKEDLASFSTQEELDELLLEGLNSGEPIEATPEFWMNRRRELHDKQALVRKASCSVFAYHRRRHVI